LRRKKSSTRLITHFGDIDYGVVRAEKVKDSERAPGFNIDKDVDRLLADRLFRQRGGQRPDGDCAVPGKDGTLSGAGRGATDF